MLLGLCLDRHRGFEQCNQGHAAWPRRRDRFLAAVRVGLTEQIARIADVWMIIWATYVGRIIDRRVRQPIAAGELVFDGLRVVTPGAWLKEED